MAISWNPYGNTAFPVFGAGDITWNAPQAYQGWGDGVGAIGGDQGSWGITPGVSTPDWFNSGNIRFSGDASSPALGIKTDASNGTYVPYKQTSDGGWAPDLSQAQTQQMNTALNPDGLMPFAPLIALGGAYGLSQLGGLGASSGWTSGFDLPFGTSAASTGGAMSTTPGWTSGFDLPFGTSAGASSLPSWLQDPIAALKAAGSAASTVGNLVPSGTQSNGLSGLGALLGGIGGYYDAKNQPSELTQTTQIDPRLGAVAYGPGGVSEQLMNLLQLKSAPNPFQQQAGQMAGNAANAMTQAGQQISALGQKGQPGFSDLLAQYQKQFSANPFLEQQQKSLTDQVTRNLNESVLPGLRDQAISTGGYGGSRQGIAEGLAMSRMNQDLAPALANLSYNAWDSANNRALAGANAAGNYGIASTNQQANLLGSGAESQWNAGSNLWNFGTAQSQQPWQNITNASQVLRTLPGNTTNTQPLYNNPFASAIGGASLGSQVGSKTNWGDILSGAGSLAGGIKDIFGLFKG